MAKIKDLKLENIHRIRACFYHGGTWTKNDLASQTGISLAGTTNILQALEAAGEIVFVGNASSTGGRKSKLYHLRDDYAHIGTVLLSHPAQQYQMATYAFNLSGEVIFEQALTSDTGKLAELCATIATLLAHDPLIRVLVLSFPGIIGTNGEVLASDFAHLQQEDLLRVLSEQTGLPVIIENDVNCAVTAYQKQHPERQTTALLYQPESDLAGTGLVINGHLHRGKNGFAGEVGYLQQQGQQANQATLSDKMHFLLVQQVTALTAVLAPDAIAYYCPSLDKDISLADTGIPQLFQPSLERLAELDSLILLGAQKLGKQQVLESKRH